jgi:hypothetical protein
MKRSHLIAALLSALLLLCASPALAQLDALNPQDLGFLAGRFQPSSDICLLRASVS